MKKEICVDAQCLCVPEEQMRGIPYYTRELIKAIINNGYSCCVCYFDYRKERRNEELIKGNLGDELWGVLKHIECSAYSYRSLMNDILVGGESNFPPYHELWGNENVNYHFPTGQICPVKIGARSIVTVHDVIPLIPELEGIVNDSNKEYLKLSLNAIKANKDIQVITDSNNTKNDLVRLFNFDESRIFVNLLGCDLRFYIPEIDDEYANEMFQGRYLLYLGAFARHKGILEAIEAFNLVKPNYKDLKLVLAGNYSAADEKVKKSLDSSPFRNDIILPGFVSDEQKRKLMSNAAAFLFPSYYEGFGLPVLEAMACGCPVICTNVSSIPEIGGNCVMYVNPGDANSLADYIIEILDDKNIRRSLASMGLKRAKLFSWESHAVRLGDIYKNSFGV